MNVCLINDIWKQASAQYTLLSKRTIHFVRLAMINPWVSRIQDILKDIPYSLNKQLEQDGIDKIFEDVKKS